MAADIKALDENITDSIVGEEVIVAKMVNDDASEMWLGKPSDLDEIARVGDFPEIEKAMPEEAVSPLQQVQAPYGISPKLRRYSYGLICFS